MPKQLNVQKINLEFIPENKKEGKKEKRRRKQTTLTIHFT